jgi:hypothetical protein
VDFEKYDCEKRAKCPPDILKLPTRATFLHGANDGGSNTRAISRGGIPSAPCIRRVIEEGWSQCPHLFQRFEVGLPPISQHIDVSCH